MMPGVAGETVAVVGRAASLIGSGNGRAIDACSVVVRVNWMLPVKGPKRDVGRRTDLLYYCGGCKGQRDAAKRLHVRRCAVDRKLRRELSRNPVEIRPTTGVVAIFDALRSGCREVRAFGFDFYSTGYASPAPAWQGAGPTSWRHDPEEDRQALRQLLESEPRFRPDAALAAALEVV